MKKETKFSSSKIEYLKLLAEQYPSIQEAASEYIRLSAILNLPKPTEHFLSDIHGEHDTFVHFLVSGSGVIRNKIDEAMEHETKERKDFLATLIYYPRAKLDDLAKKEINYPKILRMGIKRFNCYYSIYCFKIYKKQGKKINCERLFLYC